MTKKGGLLLVRLLALFFIFISVRKAWADIWLYQGLMAFRQENWQKSFELFSRARNLDGKNPRLLFYLGKSVQKINSDSIQMETVKRKIEIFESLKNEMPFYGRAWLYLTQARLEDEYLTKGQLTRKTWAMLSPLYEKAIQLESGSGWIWTVAGMNYLTAADALADEEIRRQGYYYLKRGADIRPSEYLEPILDSLWTKYGTLNALLSVTTKDYEHYQILYKFLEENHLWQERARVFDQYMKLRSLEYERLLSEGDRHYQAGENKKAYTVYQEAWWIDQTRPAAAVGMFLTRERTGQIRLPETKEKMKYFLGDPDGRHEMMDHEDMLKALLKTLNDKELDEMMKEYLAAEPVRPEVGESQSIEAAYWREKTDRDEILDSPETAGMVLNLLPGKSRLMVSLRDVSESGEGSYVQVRLGTRLVYKGFVSHRNWRLHTFDVETLGGRRWMSVELLNSKPGESGPRVQLGRVLVRYQDTEMTS